MGFGCNAAGVTGCRIIDSPRERILAILTNSFVPCNGKFPAMIGIITVFFLSHTNGFSDSIKAALILSGFILLGIAITFPVTKLLSKTLLKGIPSSFVLEMPPYRRPQFTKTLIRSVADKTVFVLGRAVSMAIPSGIVIWLLANITFNNIPLTVHFSGLLDPLGRLMGLDGTILAAFILGLPANEIVLPLITMIYTEAGTITDAVSITAMADIFRANGWNITTAICTTFFFLFHWPCSTTLLTVKKETESIKWTVISAILPTVIGMVLCMTIALFSKLATVFIP